MAQNKVAMAAASSPAASNVDWAPVHPEANSMIAVGDTVERNHDSGHRLLIGKLSVDVPSRAGRFVGE